MGVGTTLFRNGQLSISEYLCSSGPDDVPSVYHAGQVPRIKAMKG
jgi:hypothetical protein